MLAVSDTPRPGAVTERLRRTLQTLRSCSGRLVHLLLQEYQENLAGQGRGREVETAGKC